MAIPDISQLLHLLLQGPGGGPVPTSGLQAPSLSGLPLGPQGIGTGGGESLSGSGRPGGGGAGGGGLEGPGLTALLSSLLPGAATGTGLTAPVGLGTLGQLGGGGTETPLGQPGFGAGGTLSPSQREVQQLLGALSARAQGGQAGVGAGSSATSIVGLLKELLGVGKSLAGLFPSGPGQTPAGLPSGPGQTPTTTESLAGQAQRAGEFFPELQLALSLGFTLPQAQALTNAFGPLSIADAAALQGPGAGNVAQLQAAVDQGIFPGAQTTLRDLGFGGAVPTPAAGTVSRTLGIPLTTSGTGGFTGAGATSGTEGLAASGVGDIAPGTGVAGAPVEAGTGAADAASSGGSSLGSLVSAVGSLLGIGSGVAGAIRSPTALGKGTAAGSAALATAALLDPDPFSKTILGVLSALVGGGGFLSGLFGGGPSRFDLTRDAASAAASQGGAQFQAGLAAPGQTERGLFAALGAPGLGDQFGQGRSPIAVGLLPAAFSALGLPPLNPSRANAFQFDPSRSPNVPEAVIPPEAFSRFLAATRQDPSLLNLLQGSGDVSFLSQGAAQQLAAQNQVAAQNAIRAFLGLPAPPPPAPPAPPPSQAPPPPGTIQVMLDTGEIVTIPTPPNVDTLTFASA